MLETIVNDVTGIFRGTFLNGDWVSLAIAFGSVVIAAFVMRRGVQIGSMTLLALVLFVIGGLVRSFIAVGVGGAVSPGQRIVSQLEAGWLQFANLQAGTLLAYFLAFMLLILLLFSIKSLLARG
ncbi:MAG: hypothetical protein AAGJ87_13180 [Pseudomonadota bacterium]